MAAKLDQAGTDVATLVRLPRWRKPDRLLGRWHELMGDPTVAVANHGSAHETPAVSVLIPAPGTPDQALVALNCSRLAECPVYHPQGPHP